ncbi:MAG: LysE family transporter [Candidatus Omnitrophica bacterium]|nr:LysE family transporter [Candidatus Omnitrophota bacterium]
MITTFALGLATGFLLSVPIGPINLTVIHEALHKGFARGFLIGLGGIAADTLYCTMAFFGFSSFLNEVRSFWPYLQFIGGVVVILIGIYYWRYRKKNFTPAIRKAETAASHFHKAFPLGFVMGIMNVSLFALWGGVNTIFVSRGWIEPNAPGVVVCVVGIAMGSITWFALISFLIARMHYHIGSLVITRIAHTCGLLLIFFGAVLCIQTWTRGGILF